MREWVRVQEGCKVSASEMYFCKGRSVRASLAAKWATGSDQGVPERLRITPAARDSTLPCRSPSCRAARDCELQ